MEALSQQDKKCARAVAAAKMGLDVSSTVSQAATEQYKLNAMTMARKVAQDQASSS
jgi:hypothetical protein